MALSIKEILKSAKIEGMDLCKIKADDGGFYFLAEYKDQEKNIMVNSIGQLERAQWVEELRGFAAQVDAAPPVENGLEMDPAAGEAFETPLDAPEADAEDAGGEAPPAPNEAPEADAPVASVGYLLVKTEARTGTKRRAFADWLSANPGSTKKQVSRAGHSLADLRYHLERGWAKEV